MLFTMGHRPAYEGIFGEDSVPTKLGRTDDYGGGIAFGSIDEARAYILAHHANDDYEVYGLDCDWHNAYWSEEDQFFRIVENTRLFQVTI